MFTALYDLALKWAAHRHAERYLAAMSMAESVIFPIPPDVMLAPMVLAQRDRAWWLAFLTTIASVLGGLIGYMLGALALDAFLPLIESIGYTDKYLAAVAAVNDYGIWFVVIAGFTPIPFKMVTVAGGALSMALPGFILGSLIGRGARFFLVAGLIWAGGERAAQHLRSWVDLIGWLVIAIAAIGGLVWWLM